MRLIAVLLLMTVPALAAAPVKSNAWMIGTWFGSGQPGDKSEMWIARMGADGSFHAQFRACRKGKAFDSTNDGSWSIMGDQEIIQIQMVDGNFFPRTDYYQILAHDAKSQSYKYLTTGFSYKSMRVDANYKMPACDLTS